MRLRRIGVGFGPPRLFLARLRLGHGDGQQWRRRGFFCKAGRRQQGAGQPRSEIIGWRFMAISQCKGGRIAAREVCGQVAQDDAAEGRDRDPIGCSVAILCVNPFPHRHHLEIDQGPEEALEQGKAADRGGEGIAHGVMRIEAARGRADWGRGFGAGCGEGVGGEVLDKCLRVPRPAIGIGRRGSDYAEGCPTLTLPIVMGRGRVAL